MKKAVCLLLTLLLAGCPLAGCSTGGAAAPGASKENDPAASAKPQQVCGAIDTDLTPAIDGHQLPDLLFWSDGAIQAEEPSLSGSDMCVDWHTDVENLAMLQEYIDLLVNEFGFEIVDSYDADYGSDRFWSVGLRSTMADIGGAQQAMYSESGILCDVNIYGTDRGNEGQIWYSPALTWCDTGHRYGAGQQPLTLCGASAGAGLIRDPDGSYSTDDGRLTAAPGQAMVLREGEAVTVPVEYDGSGDAEKIWVKNFHRAESLYFTYLDNYLLPGDALGFYQLKGYGRGTRDSDGDGFRHDTPYLSLYHGDSYCTPTAGDGNFFEDVTARVMYADDGGDGVYYFCMQMTTAPYEIEMLVVTGSGAGGQAAVDAENIIMLEVGETAELSISPGVFGYKYEVYEWAAENDSDAIALESAGGQCTVAALRNGSATVTAVCEYGVEEPDVLTGEATTVDHTRIQTWLIVVG